MRPLLVGSGCGVWRAGQRHAAPTVEKSTFDATISICNGDLVHVLSLLATVTSVTSVTAHFARRRGGCNSTSSLKGSPEPIFRPEPYSRRQASRETCS